MINNYNRVLYKTLSKEIRRQEKEEQSAPITRDQFGDDVTYIATDSVSVTLPGYLGKSWSNGVLVDLKVDVQPGSIFDNNPETYDSIIFTKGNDTYALGSGKFYASSGHVGGPARSLVSWELSKKDEKGAFRLADAPLGVYEES